MAIFGERQVDDRKIGWSENMYLVFRMHEIHLKSLYLRVDEVEAREAHNLMGDRRCGGAPPNHVASKKCRRYIHASGQQSRYQFSHSNLPTLSLYCTPFFCVRSSYFDCIQFTRLISD